MYSPSCCDKRVRRASDPPTRVTSPEIWISPVTQVIASKKSVLNLGDAAFGRHVSGNPLPRGR